MSERKFGFEQLERKLRRSERCRQVSAWAASKPVGEAFIATDAEWELLKIFGPDKYRRGQARSYLGKLASIGLLEQPPVEPYMYVRPFIKVADPRWDMIGELLESHGIELPIGPAGEQFTLPGLEV